MSLVEAHRSRSIPLPPLDLLQGFAHSSSERPAAQCVLNRPQFGNFRVAVRIAPLALMVCLFSGDRWADANTEPDPLDGGAVKSRLVVVRVGDGKAARSVVILGKPIGARDTPDIQNTRLDILPRELVRQAVLIAVRDGLGLSTRDQVIDETPTGEIDRGARDGLVEVVSVIRETQSSEMIRRGNNERFETMFSHTTTIEPGRHLDLLKLVVSAEVLSREGFPKVLKELGLEGKPNTFNAGLGLPDRVEDHLAGLGFEETLEAVRELHRAIRTEGESPARIGALVRGYSQLGVLSEFHWHPAHKAYKARALLYAQRLVAREPDGAWGLWHRAFALALAGKHQDALTDLAAAKKAAAKGVPTAPAWVELIDACARCDSSKLAAATHEGPFDKLAALLRMVTLEFPRQSAVALQAAKDVVELEPACFRAQDAACDFRGVSTQHVTTTLGPGVLAATLPDKIRALPGLPESARQRIEGQMVASTLAEALDQAGKPADDLGEPSWGALAHLVRETRFVQVWRRLRFLKEMLVVPVGDYWNEVVTDVEGHRYRPYLDTLVLPPQQAAKPFAEFVDRVDLADIESNEVEMIRVMSSTQRPKGRLAWSIAQCHDDETARDISMTLGSSDEKTQPLLAHDLLGVSPHQPFARTILLHYEWDKVKDQADAWEKESGDSPAVLKALATRYSNDKRYDDAQRVLEQYIKKSPDVWACRKLATNFRTQGRMDRWQTVLDAYLENVEDLGLDHASVRVEVADYYIGLGQWDKAKPYAEAAAETWAEWAMSCAARCAEGEEDWDRAEAWYSRCTERYSDSSWAVWFQFCKRSGHGKIDDARNFADQYIATNSGRPDLLHVETVGYYYWLDGRLNKAKAAFAESFEKSTSIPAALALAQIADDQKEPAVRDQLLRTICTKYRDKAPRTLAICQLFLDTLFVPGGKKPLDLAGLKRQVDDFPVEGRGNAAFLVGWCLKNNGDRETAKAYLKYCLESRYTPIWYKQIAIQALKEPSGK
jgi:tetratricopeptide (TPR) repeat protein